LNSFCIPSPAYRVASLRRDRGPRNRSQAAAVNRRHPGHVHHQARVSGVNQAANGLRERCYRFHGQAAPGVDDHDVALDANFDTHVALLFYTLPIYVDQRRLTRI
jgi:hypothetical protein